jgi:RNA polymerase sigma factor (sigma-70 family)
MDTVAKIKKIPVEERTKKEMEELRAWDVTQTLPNDADSGNPAFEALPDQGEQPDESVQAEEMRIRIAHHLAGLDQKSRRVIELRFGLGGGEGLTLNDIAEMMGISQERVRQIEAQALAKMRKLAQNSREKLFCES